MLLLQMETSENRPEFLFHFTVTDSLPHRKVSCPPVFETLQQQGVGRQRRKFQNCCVLKWWQTQRRMKSARQTLYLILLLKWSFI